MYATCFVSATYMRHLHMYLRAAYILFMVDVGGGVYSRKAFNEVNTAL